MSNNGGLASRPTISLVVPCYNVAPWIDRLLDSVVQQTFKDFEVIAIDDGSTDATPERLAEWPKRDSRVRIVSQPNSGPHQARLVGISLSRANWIAFADGDDVLLPLHLENLWSGVQQQVGVVIGGIRFIGPDGTASDSGPSRGLHTSQAALVDLLIGHHANGMYSCVDKLYQRALLDSAGLEDLHMKYGEDQVFNLRVFHAALRQGVMVAGCPSPTYCYISRPGSTMRSMSRKHIDDFFVLWSERDRYAHLVLSFEDACWEQYRRMRRVAVWDFCGNLARHGSKPLRQLFKQKLKAKNWPVTPNWRDLRGIARWVKWHFRMLS